MPYAEGRVGPATLSDGSVKEARLDKSGAVVGQDAHGRFFEAVARGNVWTIATPTAGITVTANMLVSVASANAIVGLYNPTANKNYHVVRTQVIAITMATGTGFLWATVGTAGVLSPIPLGVQRAHNNLTFAIGGHTAKAFDGSVAVSGLAATDVFRAIIPLQITLLTNFTEYDNDIVVGPGAFAGIFGDTVTTSSVVKAAITWEEVPT